MLRVGRHHRLLTPNIKHIIIAIIIDALCDPVGTRLHQSGQIAIERGRQRLELHPRANNRAEARTVLIGLRQEPFLSARMNDVAVREQHIRRSARDLIQAQARARINARQLVQDRIGRVGSDWRRQDRLVRP